MTNDKQELIIHVAKVKKDKETYYWVTNNKFPNFRFFSSYEFDRRGNYLVKLKYDLNLKIKRLFEEHLKQFGQNEFNFKLVFNEKYSIPGFLNPHFIGGTEKHWKTGSEVYLLIEPLDIEIFAEVIRNIDIPAI